MKRIQFFILITSLFFSLSTLGQELVVKGMKLDVSDLSASTYERKDLNGSACALVKVQLAANGVKFEGNVIGDVVYKTGEYWVYMTSGSRELRIKHPNYLPLHVQFTDYGIERGVRGKLTYTLTISVLQAITGILNVNYQPLNAEVWIDGKKAGTSPSFFRNILVGNHTVELRAAGYTSKQERVNIEEGKTAMLSGALERQQSTAVSASSSPSSASSSGAAVETITVKGVSFNMVRVDGGTFTMGATSERGSDADSNEKPAHQVTLSTYSIGETEVTQALWQAVMGFNPSYHKGDNLPVEQVSWEDCQTFIQKLNQQTGRRFRLPTEAEWEYAARGGNKSRGYKYSGSNNLDDVAWYWENSGDKRLSDNWEPDKITKNNCRTHDVKTKQANELGLYDMSGNVYEWCQDWEANYGSGSQTDPKGPSSGSYRVDRGGSWSGFFVFCRVSIRDSHSPGSANNSLGFRLALQ